MLAEFVLWSVVVCSSFMTNYNMCRLKRLVVYIAVNKLMYARDDISKLATYVIASHRVEMAKHIDSQKWQQPHFGTMIENIYNLLQHEG